MEQEGCSMNIFSVKVDEEFVERVHAVFSWTDDEEFTNLSQCPCEYSKLKPKERGKFSHLSVLPTSR